MKFHSFYIFLFILTGTFQLPPIFADLGCGFFVSGAGEEPSKEADCQNGGGRRQGVFLNLPMGQMGSGQIITTENTTDFPPKWW